MRAYLLTALVSVFILEGAPSILFGVFIFFYLPDYPESAKFLTAAEKELAVLRMEHSKRYQLFYS
jgi:hypothetical protein